MTDFDIRTSVHGDISPSEREAAESAVRRVGHMLDAPVLSARLDLRREADPALRRPVIAKASLDIDGRILRAHVAGETVEVALDRLVERLRRSIEARKERRLARRAQSARPDDGEWRHSDRARERPELRARPAGERRIVAHKVFLVEHMTPEDAVGEMELLDHDFLLFDSGTGDAVVYRREGGGYGLVLGRAAPAPVDLLPAIALDGRRARPQSPEAAVEELDLTREPFVFFLDPASGRGRVVYRRYDGDCGLIEPA